MIHQTFNELMLRTAFSCMASDGDIDQSEISLIKSVGLQANSFGFNNLEDVLNRLVQEINNSGQGFLRAYLSDLGQASLTEKEEIQLVRIAIQTIKADGQEQYSEIKFFKIIRSKLAVSDEVLINALPEFANLEEDYLQQDIISGSYLEKLTSDYFDSQNIPQFEHIKLATEEQG